MQFFPHYQFYGTVVYGISKLVIFHSTQFLRSSTKINEKQLVYASKNQITKYSISFNT